MKSIVVNGQILASVESMNVEPVEFYARKRIGLYRNTSAAQPADVLTIVRKFSHLETQLNNSLIGMDEAVHVALLGLLCKINAGWIDRGCFRRRKQVLQKEFHAGYEHERSLRPAQC